MTVPTPTTHRVTAPRRGDLLLLALALAVALGLGACTAFLPPTGAAFDPDTVPEAHAHATAALMWPGAARAFLVTPAGDLYDGAWGVRFSATAADSPASSPRAIAAEERWMPVMRWNRHAGRVRFEFEAVASPEPAPRDTGLLVSVQVRVVNAGAGPADVRLAARLDAAPGGWLPTTGADAGLAPFVAPDAHEDESADLAWAGAAGTRTAHGWSEAGGAGAVSEVRWRLAPGETRVTRYLLPAYPETAGLLAQWSREPHAARAAAARRFWTGELERGVHLELGDPELERAVQAARVVLLGCMERRGDGWLPIGNPFQYRDVWLRDGARAVRALAVSGHVREARSLTDGLMRFQWPMGPFLSQRGQLDGTGQVLWVLDQALLRPDVDADRVGRAADAALVACRWIERQRALGRAAGWEHGPMLPFADPHDAELARAQLVGTDAWALAGEHSAARLLRAAGRASEAESIETAWRAYRADFAAELARTTAADIPPSWQRVGRDWGNLSAAVPCGAVALDDPRMAALARRVWASAGGAGLGWYGTPDSLHTYLAADLATWAMLTGRRAEADSMLDAMVHWRTASGGAAEIVARTTRDFGRNLPPHATAAAALVSLVRDMLVWDEGDTLLLTPGARAAWWRGGSIHNAPTRFGRIDLDFARKGDTADWRWTPVRTWVALTLPPGTRVAAALPAPLVAGGRADLVLAPPNTAAAHVALAVERPR